MMSSDRRRVDTAGEFFGETEVGENDMAVPADEDVFGFEVAVDDTGCVEAFDAFDDFGCVEPCAIAA